MSSSDSENRFLRHALRRDLAVSFLNLDADGAAAEVFRCAESGAGPHEWVKHHVSMIAGRANATRWQPFWKRNRVLLALLLLLPSDVPDRSVPNLRLIPRPRFSAYEPQDPFVEANKHPRVEHHPPPAIPNYFLPHHPPARVKPPHRVKAHAVSPSDLVVVKEAGVIATHAPDLFHEGVLPLLIV
jgi:hypothetical protein